MLADPKILDADANGLAAILAVISGGDLTQPRRIARGMYEIGHFSFDHCLTNVISFPDEEKDKDAWWLRYPNLGKPLNPEVKHTIFEFSPIGVCDSPEQFIEHELGKWILESEKKFVISFTKIVKANQSPRGGWRWHKWGDYIGKHKPQCEYIYDEGDEIQEVYCYHVLECLTDDAVIEIYPT